MRDTGTMGSGTASRFLNKAGGVRDDFGLDCCCVCEGDIGRPNFNDNVGLLAPRVPLGLPIGPLEWLGPI